VRAVLKGGKPPPLIIWIHGGAWMAGSEDARQSNRSRQMKRMQRISLPAMKLWMDSGVTGRNVFPHGGAKLMGPPCLFSRMPLQSMVKAKNSLCLSSEAS
jgi:hypothetical protein